MNAKFLYAATVAFALASSLAVAGENQPLTRAAVVADYNQAAAAGTLRKNDYDYDAHDFSVPSTRTRDQVLAEMKTSRPNPALIGPMRNRSYNQFGMETLRPPIVARAEVKADVVAAMRDGTLRRSDYEDVPVTVARRANKERVVAPVLAGTSQSQSSSL